MGRRKKVSSLPEYKITDVLILDDIYLIINYVQINRKDCCFTASVMDAPTINNVLKDLEIVYNTSSVKQGIRYNLEPPPEREYEDDFFVFEDFADELSNENDCFD